MAPELSSGPFLSTAYIWTWIKGTQKAWPAGHELPSQQLPKVSRTFNAEIDSDFADDVIAYHVTAS